MRVLIITYYWPPSGGGGVQRWLKLSHYLLKEGIQPIIYTPQLSDYPYRDDSLLREVDPRIEVWRRPIWTPYLLFRKLVGAGRATPILEQSAFDPKNLGPIERLSLWIRANFFVPDPKVAWVQPSLRFLCKKLRSEPVDLVLSTGPPHSMHLIGMGLKRRLQLRWWADFRDLWTGWDVLLSMRPTALAWALHKRLEGRVIKRCDKLLTVSKHWAEAFQSAGATEPLTLYNGYDTANLPSKKGSSRREVASGGRKEKFQLLHLGQLSLSRSKCFWEALSSLIEEDPSLRSSIEVALGGGIDPRIHKLTQQNPWLRSRVKWLNYVPHSSVFSYYQRASVLLAFAHPSPQIKGQIPGKLFEYLGARGPILYMGAADGEAAALIRTQEAGLCVEQSDTTAIREAIHRLYCGIPLRYRDPSPFSRAQQAQTLARAILQSDNATEKTKT